MSFCRTLSQYLMLGLLASGPLLSHVQAQAGQPATGGNSPRSAALAQKKNDGQAAHKIRRQASRHDVPPAKLPPSAPQISYVDGKLTVVADNSTLPDVLNAIQNATGARIEGVTPTSADRVFGKFGPGSPREVCGALLTGSAYDFIIMDSPDHPDSIQEIILAARSTEPADLPVSQTAGTSTPATDDVDDNQGMVDASGQVINQNQPQATPEQPLQVMPAPVQGSQPQYQQVPQDQPATQGQQSPQGEQPVVPQHPQHWGVNYPRPPQSTPQNPQ